MKIITILKSKTVIHSAITFSGTAVNGILGILFYVLIARFLGPADFGILMIAIASITMISDIADLGTDTGLIRFVGKYLPSDFQKVLKFMKLGLEVKLVVGLLIISMGWFAIPLISGYFFAKPELNFPLKLSLFGVLGALLFSFATHSIQAMQKFTTWSVLSITMNGLRLMIVLLLLSANLLDLSNTLIAYIVIPFLGFFVGLIFLPKFLQVKNEYSVANEFFSYNRWIALFTVMAAVSSRLDTFISARLLTLSEVGIYSAASQVTAVISQIVFALATVVAPKLASFNSDATAISYLKKVQLFVLGISLAGIISLPLGLYLFSTFLGPAYQQSIVPLIILFFAQLIFLISLPVHQGVYYYFTYPKLFVWVSIGHLIIVSIVGWILISMFGIIGAAVTVFIGNIFNFIVPGIWVMRKFSKKL